MTSTQHQEHKASLTRVAKIRGAGWFGRSPGADSWVRIMVAESATIADVREYLAPTPIAYATARDMNALLRQLT